MRIKAQIHRNIDLKVLASSLLAGVGYFLVGFYWASRIQIWGDEAFTIQLIKLDFTKISQLTAADVHPPLYYYLLRLWSEIFGKSELVLRSLGLGLMAIAVSLMILIAYKYFSNQVARIVGLIMILSPFAMRLGLEIRMYGLAFLIVCLIVWFYLSYKTGNSSRLSLLAMAVFSALAMYTHYYSAFLLIGIGMIEYWDQNQEISLRGIRSFMTSSWFVRMGAMAVILYLPWIGVFISKTVGFNGGFWVPKPNLLSLLYVPVLFLSNIEEYILGGLPALIVMLILAILIIFNFQRLVDFYQVVTKRARKERFYYVWRFFIRLYLVSGIMMLLISLVFNTSVFCGRYLSVSIFIAFIFVLAGLIGGILPAKARTILIVLTVVVLVIGNVYSFCYGNTRLLSGNWVTVFQGKSVLECTQNSSKGNIYLVDADDILLEYNYYLRDILSKDRDDQIYLVGDSDQIDINASTWKRVIDASHELEYFSFAEAVERFDFAKGNVWYITMGDAVFGDDDQIGQVTSQDYQVTQVCQPDARLLTSYDAARAYLLVP